MGRIIPYIMENKKKQFETTNCHQPDHLLSGMILQVEMLNRVRDSNFRSACSGLGEAWEKVWEVWK